MHIKETLQRKLVVGCFIDTLHLIRKRNCTVTHTCIGKKLSEMLSGSRH